MDANNDKQLGAWVDQRLSALNPEDTWQPDSAAALTRLRARQRESRGISRRWIWATATVLGICLLVVGLPSPQVLVHRCLECSVAVWQSFASTVSPQTNVKPENGRKMAPDFDLKDQEGNVVRLSDLKGKVVLVNFWATWCEGCQVEIPWFVEFEKRYSPQGLVVVGVSMDADGWKSVKPWLKEKKVNYAVVIGNDQLGSQYRLEGMPLTVLVDRQGKIADVHAGIVKKADTEKNIRTLLEETAR